LNFETFKCSDCQTSFDYGDVYGCYILEDGNEVSVHSQHAWCPSCDNLVAAEYIPDLVSLERALADVTENGLDDDEREFAALVETTPEQLLVDRLAMWRNCIAWRSRRVSPPRCLVCGDINVSLLYSPIVHPGCGGTLESEWLGDYQPAGHWRYTPEGERIGDSAVT
jgi:hypothetical protein